MAESARPCTGRLSAPTADATASEVSCAGVSDGELLSLYPILRQHAWQVTVAGAGLTLASAAGLGGLRTHLALPTAALILATIVLAAAATGIRFAGYAAAVAASSGFAVFLAVPYGSLRIRQAEDLEVTVVLLILGAIATEITQWGRRQQARASRSAGYLDGLLQATEVAAAGSPPSWHRELLLQQIAGVLGAENAALVPGPCPADPTAAVLHRDGSISIGSRALAADDGLPTDREVSVALSRNLSAHLEIVSAAHHARPTREQRRLALALADQLSRT